jgi:hypothetical protein
MATGVFLAAAALLVLAGCQKVIDPLPLVRAFRSTGVRVPPAAVRLLAAGEVVLGIGSVVVGNGIAVALSYFAFTGFVIIAKAKGGVLASCGCFGRADTPPTWVHAAITTALAVASLPGRTAAVDLALVVAAAAVAATAYLAMAVLPLVQVR